MFRRNLKIAVFMGCLSVLMMSCAEIQEQKSFRKLTIIGTADLQGTLDPISVKDDKKPVGGIARIAALIKSVKAENNGGVVAVSTGDDLMNKYFHAFKAKAIYETMSAAGYDLYAFGNHEFDKGPEVLADGVKQSGFQCICSDLHIKNTPLDGLCKPWLIREYNGLKVGFFSLMTENYPFVTSGKDVKLISANLETARNSVKTLKENGAQIIVALTHIGYDQDIEIAKAVPEINVIFGGHSHDYLNKMERIGNTLIVNGGEKGTYLVRLDLFADSSGKLDMSKATHQQIPVAKDIAPDPKISDILAAYQKDFPPAIVLGRTEVEWNLSKEAIRQQESPIANLVNDLMRQKFNADIVLNNAGAFRGGKVYPAGDVTDAMLKEIDEFGNYAFMVELKGSYIKDILERSAACFDEGGLLHPSGLRYAIDLKKTAQKLNTDNPKQLDMAVAGERVSDIQVLDSTGKWVALEMEKNYRVLSNSYMVNQEGDGYFWFKRYGKNPNNTYSTFYSILADFAQEKGVLNPGKPDNRLRIMK